MNLPISIARRIRSLQAELDAIAAARLKPINGGQSYTLEGSHGVQYVTLEALDQEEKRVLRQLRSLLHGAGNRSFGAVSYE